MPSDLVSALPLQRKADMFLQHASLSVDYGFSRAEQRESDSLGVQTAGRIMVLEAAKLPSIVEEMTRVFAPPS